MIRHEGNMPWNLNMLKLVRRWSYYVVHTTNIKPFVRSETCKTENSISWRRSKRGIIVGWSLCQDWLTLEPTGERSKERLGSVVLEVRVRRVVGGKVEHIGGWEGTIWWEAETGSGSWCAWGTGLSTTPQLPHLVASLPHQHLVLGDTHLLAINDASALGSRSVPVVWVFLHVQLA